MERRGIDSPSGLKSITSCSESARLCACLRVCVFVSYHAVHSKVVVLGLQLYGVRVVVADLCVACQEQTLVVHDPVKHLQHGE